ncbi:histone H2B 1/2-like [Pseudoliparis swirei]|uniref:histone H2B 1/2-like n=1 Tax=Pseudoliparis swirei TaxID=2059687 RepID=UPI0024BE4282|nr:histone H2B 1/2-like [Pseudoliparis swirei]
MPEATVKAPKKGSKKAVNKTATKTGKKRQVQEGELRHHVYKAARLAHYNKRLHHHFQDPDLSACCPELAKHAVSEGTKAVTTPAK